MALLQSHANARCAKRVYGAIHAMRCRRSTGSGEVNGKSTRPASREKAPHQLSIPDPGSLGIVGNESEALKPNCLGRRNGGIRHGSLN
jgi:hypothetical protein